MGTVLTLDAPDAHDTLDVTARTLQELHRQLSDRLDLRPCPEVDRLFGDLVRLVLATPPDDEARLLDDAAVLAIRSGLHALCSEGEYQLELAWARRIATSPSPRDELERFPYVDNYRQLTRMELDLLATVADRPARRVAFVGSGPLPLSSLLVAAELGVPVDNVDCDAEAIALGERVAAALGPVPSPLTFRRADVTHTDLGGYDVVILAALVGAGAAEKRAILDHLAASMSPGAVLLARSARGMRSLLYPAIEPAALAGFELQAVVHPVDEVVNSVVLARARAG
jgi:Nicotianamine synthase protein